KTMASRYFYAPILAATLAPYFLAKAAQDIFPMDEEVRAERQLYDLGWSGDGWHHPGLQQHSSGRSEQGSKGSKSNSGNDGATSWATHEWPDQSKWGSNEWLKPKWPAPDSEPEPSGKSGKRSKDSESTKSSKSGSADPEHEPHWGWSKPHWGWSEPSGKSGKGSKSSKGSTSSKSSKGNSGKWVFVWVPAKDDAWGWSEPEQSGKSGKGSKGSKSGGCGSGKSGKSGCPEPEPEWPAWDEPAWGEPEEEEEVISAGGSVGGWNSDGWESDGYFKDDINNVRAEVSKLIMDSDRALLAGFLRMGFHDCVGGCDGCLDMTNPDNKGLQEPIDAIYPVVTKFKDSYSRADIWAMATLVSADLAVVDGRPHGLHFPMRYIGRTDCEGSDAKGVGGPDVTMPSTDFTTHELLAFFKNNFDMDMEETVTIMGVHSVAVASRDASGFGNVGKEDGWVFDAAEFIMDNRYYNMLIGDDMTWDLELVHNENGVPSRHQWYHEEEGKDERPIMTNSDMALVRDLSDYMTTDEDGTKGAVSCVFKVDETESGGITNTRQRSVQSKPVACPVAHDLLPIMQEYQMDNELWLIDFEQVLEKMLKSGYDGGRRKLTRIEP
ncbi:hypothetical protein ACHAXA_006580, partial [Cyclostephanos tholiformis]